MRKGGSNVPNDEDSWRELALRVISRRRELGMRTQKSLADAAGVSVATITRLESGREFKRRSSSWELIERALKWPDGYMERWVNDINATGFLIRTSELSEIEPKAREAIKGALMATLPGVTVSEILKAESAAIKALRDRGLLPPED